jgi:Tol biopolymer transport system component
VGGALTGFFEVLWSFDGQSLFYWGWTTGTNTGLHRIDLAAKEFHYYPDEGGFNTMNFSWSPDGRQFAYVDEDDDGELALFLRDEVTGQSRVLSREYIPYRPPVWSPDGTHLVFEVYRYASSGPHDVELYILELATGDITPIPGDGESSRWPVWSPDGTFIAYSAGVFSSDEPFSSNIVVVNRQGRFVRRLAHTEGEARAYAWTTLPRGCG